MNLNMKFVGGDLAGLSRCPVSEEELTQLGYRVQIKSQPVGDEVAAGFAVPIAMTAEEAHKAVLAELNDGKERPRGKRSF